MTDIAPTDTASTSLAQPAITGPAPARPTPGMALPLSPLTRALQQRDLAALCRWFDSEARDAAHLEDRPETFLAAADLLASGLRWSSAAAAIACVHRSAGQVDPSLELRRRLYANLGAIEKHRPALYRTLLTQGRIERHEIVMGVDGAATLTERYGETHRLLSAGNAPLTALRQAADQLGPHVDSGEQLALEGIGDGYLLANLAARPSNLVLGMVVPHFLVEPDAGLVMACLMIHDYTGPLGPIEQQRIFWCVGQEAVSEFEALFTRDPHLVVPRLSVRLGFSDVSLSKRISQLAGRIADDEAETARRVLLHYRSPDRLPLGDVIAGRAGRKPRLLMITTRFSTVLQYSTADAAEAMTASGWEVHVAKEQHPWQRMTPRSIRAALAAFLPDIVLQIDHHRFEHGDVFPEPLPFVCWIQDALPNLNNAESGRKLGRHDYVMTGLGGLYRTTFDYPARQIIDAHRFTRLAARPAQWQVDGDDLVYVSHNSQPPAEVMASLEAACPAGLAKDVMRDVCREVADHFDRGGTIATLADVDALLARLEQARGLRVDPPAARRQMIEAVFYRLVNPLYRRQGLTWAKQVAQGLGLRLAVYGKGWETDPTFSPHARGVVSPGAPMEELARRSRFILKLEPYFCISHQRALDALVAGGCVLFRRHATDLWMPRLAALLENHPVLASIDSRPALEAHVATLSPDDPLRTEMADLLTQAASMDGFGDTVEMIRRSCRAGILTATGEPLPAIEQVSFTDAPSLQAIVRRFVSDPAGRSAVAGAQCAAVESRLTYAQGLARVMREIASMESENRRLGVVVHAA